MKPRVFVVQPIPEVGLEILREIAEVTVYPYHDRQITTAELVAAVKRCDYLFAMSETVIPAEVINANPDLKGIATFSVMGGITDLEAVRARRLPLTILNPVDTIMDLVCTATADLTMAMVLSLAYRLVESDRFTRCGKFKQEHTMLLMGQGCPGKTVGLIGLGRLGQFLAPRIRAFEMKTLYTKRNRLPLERERELGVEWAPDKDAVLRQSDFVCIVCDYNPSTHLMIGAREFGLMKPTAYFINTGRARIVDEQALILALKSGTIAGAGLDVYWDEPDVEYARYEKELNVPTVHDPAPNEELYTLSNVVLAPHNGGATWDVRGAMARSAARNLVAMIKGERPPGLFTHS